MALNLEKISKIFRGIDLSKVVSELESMKEVVTARTSGNNSYRPHRVTVNNTNYTATDARAINAHHNSSGRGNYRYLWQDGEVVGLAEHGKKGRGYRQVA